MRNIGPEVPTFDSNNPTLLNSTFTRSVEID